MKDICNFILSFLPFIFKLRRYCLVIIFHYYSYHI
nr:MAG TPA: hypothetical protein [Caudoviricetes sp.]